MIITSWNACDFIVCNKRIFEEDGMISDSRTFVLSDRNEC